MRRGPNVGRGRPVVVRSRAGWLGGQGIVEYGLILGGSALLALGLLAFAGGTVADVLDLISRAVEASEGR